jgi:hypothetical protein
MSDRTNLIDKIDEYFLRDREHKEKICHYPSEINECRRKSVYKWIGTKQSNSIDASGIWKMEIGNSIHLLIYQVLEKSGLDIINEVAEKYKHPDLKHEISYRVDNIFLENGEAVLIEVKTTYGHGAVELKKTGPKIGDLMQVFLYMDMCDLKKAYMLYVARDNMYRMQFDIEFKNNIFYVNGTKKEITIDNLFEIFKNTEKAVDLYHDCGELPKRDYIAVIKNGEIKDKIQFKNVEYKTNWQCGYCSYKNKCWENVLFKEGIFYGENKLENKLEDKKQENLQMEERLLTAKQTEVLEKIFETVLNKTKG